MSASCRILYTHQAALSYSMKVALTQSAGTAVLTSSTAALLAQISFRLSENECCIHRDIWLSNKKEETVLYQLPHAQSVYQLLRVIVLPIPVILITIHYPPRAELGGMPGIHGQGCLQAAAESLQPLVFVTRRKASRNDVGQ